MTNYKNYRRDDIGRKLRLARFYPLDIMVTGVTGAGKSSTMNCLFNKAVTAVGNGVEPETMRVDAYALNDVARFWDTPGLGDSVQRDKEHSKRLVELLYKTYTLDNTCYGWIDMVLVILEGSSRDIGTTYNLLNNIIIPNFPKERILIAINQCDMAMKGRHWDYERKCPDAVLTDFLDEKALSIQRRVREATGVNIIRPVWYSAEYDYHIEKLFDLIIDNMPVQRRSLML